MTLRKQIAWYRELLEKCKDSVTADGIRHEQNNGIVSTNPDIDTAMKLSKMLLLLEKNDPKKPKKLKAKGPQLDLE